MPKYTNFDETPVWQEAARLYNLVLDLIEKHGNLLAPGFRTQLDRAALTVSNCLAEAFERRPGEVCEPLAIARQAAGDVRSMCRLVERRTALAPIAGALRDILASADSCLRQTSGWMGAAANASARRQQNAPASAPPGPSRQPEDGI